MTLSLHLLGVPRAEKAGKHHDLMLDKPASVLFYLAQRQDWVSRSELAFLYRPDVPENLALSNVRVFIYRAKDHFWAENLEIEKFRVRFQVKTDVRVFEDAISDQQWPRALALYRGNFLSGLHLHDVPGYETWLELERQTLAQKWRLAALNHSQDLIAQQDFTQAEAWLEQILKSDPLDEEALQVYLRVLFAAGKRAQAKEAYEQFKKELENELEVEPLATTRSLLESLNQSHAVATSLAEPTLKADHNLPAPSTRFIGRKRELAELGRLLNASDCRLISLVGLGGMGKTRLLLEFASQQLQNYREGVWFIPLAGVTSADLLVQTIASAVNLVFSASTKPEEQLLNFLREKEVLLLLDNFEHLLDGAPFLETLLQEAPRLKLLVTSRVALALKAEWLFDVEGLTYPPADTQDPLDSFDAVTLFSNRARQVSATFVPEGESLLAVANLTRKVEGLPLALELAAPWIRSLTVSQLLLELDKNLDLLSGQLRDLPERQRSMGAVLEYSWECLKAKEQGALARLAVFQNGFDLEAANRVASVHLALVLSLINHSLVRKTQEGRYQLHELVSKFVLAKLDEPTKAETETAFSQYYLGLVAEKAVQLRGRIQIEVKHALLKELDNIRAAWTIAIQAQAWDRLDAALEGVHLLWLRTNFFHEGRDLFKQLSESLPPEHSRLLARAGLRLGFFERNLGLFQEAKETFLAASKALGSLNLSSEFAYSLHELGNAVRKLGDPESAENYFEASLSLCNDLDNPTLLIDCLFHLALLRRDQGRFADARACLERCILLGTELEDLSHLATLEAQLGVMMLQSGGDKAEARRYLERGLSSFKRLDNLDEASIVLYNLGRLAYEEGDLQQSDAMLQECLALRRYLGNYYVQESVLSTLGEIARDQERYEVAITYFEQSLSLSRQLQSPVGQAYSLSDLADVARRLGDSAKARVYFQRALSLLKSRAMPKPVVFEILYFTALFCQAAFPRESYLLIRYLRDQEGLSHYLKSQMDSLYEELESSLSSSATKELNFETGQVTLESLLERQSRLFENEF
ncbi:MAG: tetratricopeptide repeat protein [Trueperaceae bacterium]|nr:tetratricopeptide repeat protein [Trueperaceae bacterium]